MAANDPVSKCVACQFNIPPGDFVFAPAVPGLPSSPSGELSPPTAPGYASLIKATIDAFIAAMLFLVNIINMLLSNIPDFINWLSTLTADPVQFMIDRFNELILNPFIAALEVDVPPFDLTLKIFGSEVTVPLPGFAATSQTGPLAPTLDNPNWVSQLSGFISLMIGLLKLPFDALMAIVEALVNFEIPSVDLAFLENIWARILPSMGFEPGTSAFEGTTKLGLCIMEQLTSLIPPAFPPGGFSPGAAPIDVIDSPTSTHLVHDVSTVGFNNVTSPARQFQVSKANAGTHTIKTTVSGADAAHFVLTAPILTLTDAQPDGVFFIQLLTNDPETNRELQVVIQVTEPGGDVKVFKFKVSSNDTSLEQLLQTAYTLYGGEWDPEFNLWGIRRRVGESHSDLYDDALGLTYRRAGAWHHLVFHGTTKAGKYWADIQPSAEYKALGPETLVPMFQRNIWRKRNHFAQFPALVAANYTSGPEESRVIGVTTAFVDAAKKCKQRPEDRLLVQTNSVIDFHTTASKTSAARTGPIPGTVGRYSAGCSVVQSIAQFYEIMVVIFEAEFAERHSYSYMLFTDTQVPELNTKVIDDYGV